MKFKMKSGAIGEKKRPNSAFTVGRRLRSKKNSLDPAVRNITITSTSILSRPGSALTINKSSKTTFNDTAVSKLKKVNEKKKSTSK